ncbi:MAG: hypothetical protein H6550_10830 [Chitinophagales bacterium]|nr:hypothetical protein [Chitinophagales bacterium]
MYKLNNKIAIVMRNLSLIVFILLVVTNITSCRKETIEPGKIEQVDLNTISRLNRIHFMNDSVCIVGGGERFHEADIITSTDAGQSWSLASYPEAGKGMYGMAVDANGKAWLCGTDGKLLATNDHGATWSFHQLAYWWFFNSMAFTTNGRCIALATNAQNYGTIVRIDSNYNISDTTYMKFGLNDIAMPLPGTGYIAGFGAVLKTDNGGDSWAYMDVKNDNFMSVYCLNEQEVWVCGYRGTIYHTTNGGTTWDKLRNGNLLIQKNYMLLDIYFKDSNKGWACGEDGLLIYTTDGGNSWTEYKKFTGNALRAITLAPDGRLIIVGDNGSMYKLAID